MRRPTGMTVATVVAVVVISYLLLLPLVMQLITSLRGPFLPFGVPSAHWSLDSYLQIYSLASDLGSMLVTTAAFVGGAAIIGTVIAWTLAWLVVRTDLPYRNVVTILVLVPFIIPPIVMAQAYLLMVSPNTGVLNEVLRAFPWWNGSTGPVDPFAFVTIIAIQGLSAVVFPFLMFLPIIQNMDGSVEEAGRMSGASPFQTFRRVTLPVLWPASLGVITLSIILLLGTLEIPLLFGQQSGGDIFSLKLWNLLQPSSGQLPQYGIAAAYGMIFLVITLIIFRLYLRATRDAGQRASITGKGYRPTRLPLGKWRWPALIAIAVYMVPTAVLPLLALLWSALTPYAMPMTFDNLSAHASASAFGAALVDAKFWASLGRTFFIAAASATIAVTVASVAAYVVARGRASLGTRLLDILASSSVAIPATIAGFSAYLFYLVTNPVLGLSGTIWVLILAYAYRVSVSYRVDHSAILQINRELEESAATSGASRLAVFRRIVVPLLLPTLSVTWIPLFILGTHEFTLPAFLATPDTRPFSFYLFSLINPHAAQLYAPNQGAAMAIIFTAIVAVIGYALRLLTERRSVARMGASRRRRPHLPAPAADPAQ